MSSSASGSVALIVTFEVPPFTSSTWTSVTPGRAVSSSVTERTQWPQVTEELTALPGVTDVQVELVNGGTSKVTISATEPLADEDIQAAVEEAGYAIAPPRSLI